MLLLMSTDSENIMGVIQRFILWCAIILHLQYIAYTNRDFINLNEIVDSFPLTTFVKVYVDALDSANFGPSLIPVTLLKYTAREKKQFIYKKVWGQFFTLYSLIGARCDYTFHLVFT